MGGRRVAVNANRQGRGGKRSERRVQKYEIRNEIEQLLPSGGRGFWQIIYIGMQLQKRVMIGRECYPLAPQKKRLCTAVVAKSVVLRRGDETIRSCGVKLFPGENQVRVFHHKIQQQLFDGD